MLFRVELSPANRISDFLRWTFWLATYYFFQVNYFSSQGLFGIIFSLVVEMCHMIFFECFPIFEKWTTPCSCLIAFQTIISCVRVYYLAWKLAHEHFFESDSFAKRLFFLCSFRWFKKKKKITSPISDHFRGGTFNILMDTFLNQSSRSSLTWGQLKMA